MTQRTNMVRWPHPADDVDVLLARAREAEANARAIMLRAQQLAVSLAEHVDRTRALVEETRPREAERRRCIGDMHVVVGGG